MDSLNRAPGGRNRARSSACNTDYVKRAAVPPALAFRPFRPVFPRSAKNAPIFPLFRLALRRAAYNPMTGGGAFMAQNDLTDWDFPSLRLLAGFPSRTAAAAWLGLSERTLRRQEQAGDGPAWRLLGLKAGFLGLLDAAWDGWQLHAGALRYGPQEWRPGDVLAIQYERALIAELQRQVRQAETTAPAHWRAPVLRLDDYR
jgi:hypothetical protein